MQTASFKDINENCKKTRKLSWPHVQPALLINACLQSWPWTQGALSAALQVDVCSRGCMLLHGKHINCINLITSQEQLLISTWHLVHMSKWWQPNDVISDGSGRNWRLLGAMRNYQELPEANWTTPRCHWRPSVCQNVLWLWCKIWIQDAFSDGKFRCHNRWRRQIWKNIDIKKYSNTRKSS